MAKRQSPWSVPVAGVLVLLAAAIGGVATASDPATRLFGLRALASWQSWGSACSYGCAGRSGPVSAWSQPARC